MPLLMESITVTAPINIALIKYWGKRDTELNLPINDSISVTLNGAFERTGTCTTLRCQPSEFDSIAVTINGQTDDKTSLKIQKIFEELRIRNSDLARQRFGVSVVSKNFSPTSAGLASSASGFAALSFALHQQLSLVHNEVSLNAAARIGSGSACRSLFGGFVRWSKGSFCDGTDSMAHQIVSEDFWPEFRAILVVMNAKEKSVSSRLGMQTSVQTSDLLQARTNDICMNAKCKVVEEAILRKDFESLAPLIMRDSNQFHAVCMDSYPPIFYLDESSKAIIQAVHRLNQENGRCVAAYTFDAGPNAVIFFLEQDMEAVKGMLQQVAPEVKRVECRVGSGPKIVEILPSLNVE